MPPHVLPGPSVPPPPPAGDQAGESLGGPATASRRGIAAFLAGGRSPRLKVFLLVFLSILAIGLGLVLARTAHYQAVATVELSASDDPAQAGNRVDTQFLFTQVENITARSMLEAVVERLGGDIATVEGERELNRLETRVSAFPVPGTALVKVAGVGEDPRLIALQVNTLIDVYADALNRKRLKLRSGTNDALKRQVEALGRRIDEKQRKLSLFQDRYDITSIERAENEQLSRLQALSADRDQAATAAREAQAAYEQVEAAVGSDEVLLSSDDLQTLSTVATEIAKLQQGLKAKAKVYTKRYMALDPNIREARRRLQQLRKRWNALKREAEERALVGARQARDQADTNLRRVEAELKQHKLAAKEFADHYQQFKLIASELTELRATRQQLHNELTRLELNQAAELARMTVLEKATPPSEPIRNDKARDIGIVLGIALLLGLFGVWLVEFLTRSKKEGGGAPTVTVNLGDSLRLAPAVAAPRAIPLAPIAAPDPAEAMLADGRDSGLRRIEAGPVVQQPAESESCLDAAERILGPGELAILWSACEGEARVVLALLLNGVGPQELASLNGDDLDLAHGELGVGERIIPLSPALQCLLSGSPPLPATQALLSDDAGAPGGIDALLGCAAIDAGLEAPIEVDAGRVQRSYLVWLVSQGVKLADLKRVAGTLSPGYLASFAPWSPPGPGHTLEQIEPFLPFLVEMDGCGSGSPE
jgi:uncharacterized protein involved in exopolysaccharide biosynthesis